MSRDGLYNRAEPLAYKTPSCEVCGEKMQVDWVPDEAGTNDPRDVLKMPKLSCRNCSRGRG